MIVLIVDDIFLRIQNQNVYDGQMDLRFQIFHEKSVPFLKKVFSHKRRQILKAGRRNFLFCFLQNLYIHHFTTFINEPPVS